ncbi:MAG: MFS transporter [Janthinobacterium lividum]
MNTIDSSRATPLTRSGVLWYSLANLGYGAFYAFNNFVLPLWLGSYTHNAVLLNFLGGSHSFEGVFIQPVVGSISDRLSGPGGRRRPFMRLFILVSALFLLLTPAAGLLPHVLRFASIVGCIFLFTMTFNVAVDPYQALLTDITTPEQRGKVTGTWFFVGALGQVLILVLLAVLLLDPKMHVPLGLGFPLVSLLMLVTTLLTCAKTKEPHVQPPHETPRGHRDDILLAIAGLKTLHQARIYMLMFLLYGAGVGAVTPLLTTFIKQVTHCGNGVALGMSAFLLVMTAVGSLIFGPLSDRIGAKRLLILSLVLVSVASVNGLWVSTLLEVGVILGVAGLGIGAQNASAYPLLTRIVPVKEIGFYVGFQTAAASLAGPAAGLLTGELVNLHSGNGQSGYRLIFAVCAVCVTLALVVLSFLREQEAAGEIAAREGALEPGPSPSL